MEEEKKKKKRERRSGAGWEWRLLEYALLVIALLLQEYVVVE